MNKMFNYRLGLVILLAALMVFALPAAIAWSHPPMVGASGAERFVKQNSLENSKTADLNGPGGWKGLRKATVSADEPRCQVVVRPVHTFGLAAPFDSGQGANIIVFGLKCH